MVEVGNLEEDETFAFIYNLDWFGRDSGETDGSRMEGDKVHLSLRYMMIMAKARMWCWDSIFLISGGEPSQFKSCLADNTCEQLLRWVVSS